MRYRIHFSPPPSLLFEVPDGICLEDAEERSFKFVEETYGLEVAECLQWELREEPEDKT